MYKYFTIRHSHRATPPISLIALLFCLLPATLAKAQTPFDFTQINSLASGAVTGAGPEAPIRGFELLLIRDGRVIYKRAFGTQLPNEVVQADSATKTISGAVIMSLVDSSPQPFALSTRLSTYIPAFSGDKSTISIAQAFSHNSGLPTGSNAVSSSTVTLQQAALIIAGQPLIGTPGSVFAYGGASMHAAGAVAELAGQAPWNTLFQQRLAGPLGMTQTTFTLTTPSNPRVAGGCASNAIEFGRVMEMLRSEGVFRSGNGSARVLSAASVQAMFTRQPPLNTTIVSTPLDDSSDYGVGVWLDRRDANGRLTGALAAGARGFCAFIDFDSRVVGVFATESSFTANVLLVLDPLRDAVRQMIANAPRGNSTCVTECDSVPGADVADIFAFLAAWFAMDPAADFVGVDGVLTSDIFAYLQAWFAGC